MISASTKRSTLAVILLLAAAMPAYAHVGIGTASSFTAGLAHPLSGLD
ncbi:protein hupE, partial [Mesorhizobium sp. M2D.F.Ca.ET.223.01.1.1]